MKERRNIRKVSEDAEGISLGGLGWPLVRSTLSFFTIFSNDFHRSSTTLQFNIRGIKGQWYRGYFEEFCL